MQTLMFLRQLQASISIVLEGFKKLFYSAEYKIFFRM